jgi:cell fate (sporulation/competence/biofilm development) regulator YlbF (YheA/YmcA/DUF963 family)
MSTLYMESLALASELRSLVVQLMRREPELARRLKRASDEAPERLAESMCLTGRARRHELEAARSALREVLACVRAAVGAGHLKERDAALEARLGELVQRISEPLALKSA